MRGLLAWGLCLAGAAAQAQPKLSYESYSSDGRRAVRRWVEDGKCRLEVVNETAVEWTLPRCPGLAEDLVFLSNSGRRFWVLRAYPKLPAVKGGRPHWESAVVARLYDARGRVLGRRRLTEWVGPKDWSQLRQSEHRFKWLEGVLDVPGKKPRVNAKNEVEFETVGARTIRLPF